MNVYVQLRVGQVIDIKGKNYFVVGTAGINCYLVVEKDANPEELADVKFFQQYLTQERKTKRE